MERRDNGAAVGLGRADGAAGVGRAWRVRIRIGNAGKVGKVGKVGVAAVAATKERGRLDGKGHDAVLQLQRLGKLDGVKGCGLGKIKLFAGLEVFAPAFGQEQKSDGDNHETKGVGADNAADLGREVRGVGERDGQAVFLLE